MKIQQWEDKGLAQFSYAVLSECASEIVLIDPARDPQPYLAYARANDARITGIIETHPHADFVSSHLELHQRTGAPIYVSSRAGAGYPHAAFDEGAELRLGKIRLYPLHTPGHSPDSISIVLEHAGTPRAVFTGDTLFVGDCGRPDLREEAGSLHATRTELARQMYHSLRQKLATLPDDVAVYPAHGAGTLCGKALSEAPSSTIGAEKLTNWCLQPVSEEEFVGQLLSGQPFIPAYFPYDVEVNRKGAPPFRESIEAVKRGAAISDAGGAKRLKPGLWIIDARDKKAYQKGYLPHSINLMEGEKFETWLGSVIQPGERFYLAAESIEQLDKLLERVAAIGYEGGVEEAFVLQHAAVQAPPLDVDQFKNNPETYTIVDVRNVSEVQEKILFPGSLSIPLGELRKKVAEIPTGKPIVVHCAGGYRSAAASSLIRSQLDGTAEVYDLGEAVKDFNVQLT